jgi:hypothetical protein
MENQLSNVYVFKSHFDAENAVRSLGMSGFNMKQLSIIGRGYHTEEHPLGFYTKGDRIRSWGKFGVFWGAIWGLLFAPAVFILPGLGTLAMAGPVVTVLVSALEGAVVVGGLSALGCAMLELGVDHSNAIKYEVALKADQFLLMVHGSEAEMQHAKSMLEGPKKQLTYEHKVPDEATDSIVTANALV